MANGIVIPDPQPRVPASPYSPNDTAWRRLAAANPFVFTRQSYGAAVSPQDFLGWLIRNPDSLITLDSRAYEYLIAQPIVADAMLDLCAPIVNASQQVVGTGDPNADAALTTILNSIDALPEAKEQLLFSYITGIRLVEMLWGVVTTPDGQTAIAPGAFVPHDAQRFAFDASGQLFLTNDFYTGAWSNYNNVPLTRQGDAQWVHPAKMLIMRYLDGDGRNGYGHGTGQVLYRFVKAKETVMAYWLEYLRLYSVPSLDYGIDPEWVNQQSGNSTNPTQQPSAMPDLAAIVAQEAERVNDVRNGSVFAHDARNVLRPIDPTPTPPQLFHDLLRLCDEEIKRCIIGDDAARGAAGEDRAFATLATLGSAKKHARTARLGRFLARVLGEQLVRPILKFNPQFSHVRDSRPRVIIKAPMLSELERLELMMRFPRPVLDRELYELSGVTQPTLDQRQRGEAFIPSAMTPQGTPMLGA